ncbi:MAG TPA: hypothetical protein VD969_28730 [Symbiobacteriaceae bacterium]|nr:hypothetical protein [Symbiobacteriaceae bacterium]
MMWSELNDLNERLARAADHQARLGKLQNRVQALEKEKKELQAHAEQLRRIAHQEEADVRRLEGISLTGLFHSVLGSKDEQLYKERQEALAAELKYDEAQQRVEAIDRDLERARADLSTAAGTGDDYESLMRRKEDLVRRVPSAAPRLLAFGEQEQRLQWQIKELTEAYNAGRSADSALSQVEDCLGSAAGWGTFDMLGGGLIATAVKHSRIDDARRHVHYAQQALSAFQRELKDVAMVIQVGEIQIGSFATFADFFFDGLIADWIVQSRINDSRESARRARDQVGELLRVVYQKIQQSQAELGQLQQQRQGFIAGYQG